MKCFSEHRYFAIFAALPIVLVFIVGCPPDDNALARQPKVEIFEAELAEVRGVEVTPALVEPEDISPAEDETNEVEQAPFPLNKFNFFSYVIPALSRNPESKTWIPAPRSASRTSFAGMTKCEIHFLETALVTSEANHSEVNQVKSEQAGPGREEPAEAEPNEIETEKREAENVPAKAEPNLPEPNQVESDQVDPNQTEPAKAEPNETKPKIAEPDNIEPNDVEPDSVDPNVVEPNDVDPNTVEPNAVEPNQPDPNEPKLFHDKCAEILRTFVNKEGMVDYQTLRRKRLKFIPVLEEFNNLERSVYNSWSKNDKIAFWINAYNIHKLKVVTDNYPIRGSVWLIHIWGPQSVRHIEKLIKRFKFLVMDEQFTFSEIDSRFFRKEFDDPRIFFALTHATLSGPLLRNEPYYGYKLDEQLNEQVLRFLSSQRSLRADKAKEKVYISAIFQATWYGKEFISTYGIDRKFKDQQPATRAVLNFITHYVPNDTVSFLEVGNYSVQYIKYDWMINDGK